MPRPKNTVPAYKLHKPSGQAVVRFTLPDGRRRSIYLGKFNSPESKTEYARLLKAGVPTGKESKERVLSPLLTRDITVAELLVKFLEHAATHYRHPDGRPTSEIHGFRMVAKPFKELFAYLPAREFGASSLKKLRDRMIELEWCRKTVNKNVGRVRSIFRWGASEELVPAELLASLASVSGLSRGRTEAHDPDPVAPVSEEHIVLVLPLVPRGVRGLIQFQRYTGARPGEAVSLCMADIDTTAEVWTYRPTAHKNQWRGKARAIAIGPRGRSLIEEYKTADPIVAVFQTAKRAAYTVSGYRQAVETACVAAGIPAWTPNQIRHAFATEARRTFGLEAARVSLGHSEADTTQIYAERDNALSARVAAQIG